MSHERHKTAPPPLPATVPVAAPLPAMVYSARSLLISFALLGGGTLGCGRNDPSPEPEPVAPDISAADSIPAPDAVTPAEDRRLDPAPDAAEAADEATTYAAHLRARLLAGDAAAVRESLPPGAIVAVGALRRALVRAEPGERAAAVKALGTVAELIDRRATFLSATDAVRQGETPGVNLPGWVAPVIRAVAAGPAASADPADLTDATLIDGTVAVLLEDPTFRAGLERWSVAEDVPRVPPEAAGAEADPTAAGETVAGEEEDVVGLVTLTAEGDKEVAIPVVASGGAWVPAVVEATAPVWAAKADSAGGTGAAAVLAAAGPHLEEALAAETQEAFDAALRAATDAALAAAADPPAPVPDDQRVTVELTRPLTARQAADLLTIFEAATDDPARAVSRAAPRASGPGWRVTVGPVGDVSAWLARVPALAGAEVEGRTVTLALEPPPASVPDSVPEPEGAGVEPGEPPGAD